MTDLLYLYGFVPESTAAPRALSGIADRPVHLLPFDGFQAAVSVVDSAAYGAAAIETRLQDLGWVAEQGLAHERVVAWFVDLAQILPAPLFTLYSGAAALLAVAEARAPQVRAELARLAGLREWDLKVAYHAQKLAAQAGRHSADVAQLDSELSTATPGRRYLLEKKRTEVVRKEVAKIARQLADQVLEQVGARAVQSVTLPLPTAKDDLPVVLHAALLVAHEQEPALIDEIRALAADGDTSGLTVSFSGPWAPYRFVAHD